MGGATPRWLAHEKQSVGGKAQSLHSLKTAPAGVETMAGPSPASQHRSCGQDSVVPGGSRFLGTPVHVCCCQAAGSMLQRAGRGGETAEQGPLASTQGARWSWCSPLHAPQEDGAHCGQARWETGYTEPVIACGRFLRCSCDSAKPDTGCRVP